MEKFIMLSDIGLQDVIPYQYGEEKCRSQKVKVRTMHEYYILHYVFSGKGYYYAHNQVFTVTGGQAFIIHPREPADYEPDRQDPWHYCWVGFDTRLNIPRLTTDYVLDAPYAEHIFRSLGAADEWMKGREYYISGKVLEFLSTIAQPEAGTGHKTFVNRAVEYIRKNYTAPITIEKVAEHLNVSHSYFSTMFRHQMGVSPHQFLMDIRLENAAALMSEHGFSVSEAALSVGYSNVYNFSKMFKKKYGVSPSHYTARRRDALEKHE